MRFKTTYQHLFPLPEGEGARRAGEGHTVQTPNVVLSRPIPLIRPPRFFQNALDTFSRGEKDMSLESSS